MRPRAFLQNDLMSVFSVLLDVLGPVVLLVAIGAVFGERLNIDTGSLNRLAYWVLGPAFVFDILSNAEIERAVVVRLVLAGLAGMAAAALLAVVVLRLRGESYSVTAAAVMTGAYGNVGNAGLAISIFALGDQAIAAASVLMLTINISGIVLGIGLASARKQSPLAALARAFTAPMSIAGAIAVGANLLGWAPPLLINRGVGLLSNALIPVMLFGLGMQLVASGRPDFSFDLGVSTVAKLAVAPLAAGMAAVALGLTGDNLDVVVIQSAMPPAVFCVVVALEHDLEPRRVTTAVVTMTMLSILTLPIVLALVT